MSAQKSKQETNTSSSSDPLVGNTVLWVRVKTEVAREYISPENYCGNSLVS